MKILITHPGRQHSHQAAVALNLAGMLAGYWAGVPAVGAQTRHIPYFLRRPLSRYAPVDLPASRVRWFPLTPALRRLGDAVLPGAAASRADFIACRLFDRWVASGLRWATSGGPPDAVVACEISALSTFRTARSLGLVTILDAPSLHHSAQDRLHGTTDSPALHRRIRQVKDAEVALADHIITVSRFARETYLDASLAPECVHAVTLGADLDLFTPSAESRVGGEEFVFLFSGATSRRKGFDLLLEAFARVRREVPLARLRVVGPRGDAWGLLAGADSGSVSASGPVCQEDLAHELRRADCLVLPSRNDSFGMVVAEALACGVPVLVSDKVGAKELVSESRTGWIVPADDVGALASRMAWCASHPAVVRGLRLECRRSASAATWASYHTRFAQLLRSIVPTRRVP
jgi:glycosyltransferase involved in cell wall biosynthesis